jgi:hypothetical protein
MTHILHENDPLLRNSLCFMTSKFHYHIHKETDIYSYPESVWFRYSRPVKDVFLDSKFKISLKLVKVYLVLNYLIRHREKKTYGEVEVLLHHS